MRQGAFSAPFSSSTSGLPSNRAANVPTGTRIRTVEDCRSHRTISSPMPRKPPARRVNARSTPSLRGPPCPASRRSRLYADLFGSRSKNRGVRRRKMEPFNSIVGGASLGRARKSPDHSKTRTIKSTRDPRRSLQPCCFAASSLTGRARIPSLVTMWQAAPSSAFSKKKSV